MQLKARLQAVGDFIVKGNVVADIGTDHAYLPIYLVENGLTEKALACDVNEGPYKAAKRAVSRVGLDGKIEVRLGDGMTVLAPDEVQTVVMAGMGGATMVDILDQVPLVTKSVQQFVFQPMNAARQLRVWLQYNEWSIVRENLVVEDGRLYEVIAAIQGKDSIGRDILFEVGPRLWEDRHPLLRRHVTALLGQSQNILSGMGASAQAMATDKYGQEELKAKELEEMLRCL